MTTIEIIFLVIAIAFVVLVGFLVNFILEATKTLKKVNGLVDDMNTASRPLLSTVSSVGESLNSWTEDMKREYRKEQLQREEKSKSGAFSLIDLALLGLVLWKKIKKN